MSLILVTTENKKIDITINRIFPFKFITAMLNIDDDIKNGTDEISFELEEDLEIPLDIKYETLKKILEFSDYELNNKDILLHDKLLFYNQFFTCSDTLLCDIMNSADYLQYDYLLDQACEKLSDDILKCDTVDDVKKKFKITREFTEDEENEILDYAKM